jgi:hypothetical protein
MITATRCLSADLRRARTVLNAAPMWKGSVVASVFALVRIASADSAAPSRVASLEPSSDAQTSEAPSKTPTFAGVRERFGIGFVGGGSVDGGPAYFGREHGGGPGFYARGGLQITRETSVEVDLSMGSAFLISFVRVGVLAGWTPRDWMTLSLGPSMSSYESTDDGFISFLGSSTSGATAFGGTLRVDVHARRQASAVRRTALTFGLAIDAGLVKCNADGSVEKCSGAFRWNDQLVDPLNDRWSTTLRPSYGAYASVGKSWY